MCENTINFHQLMMNWNNVTRRSLIFLSSFVLSSKNKKNKKAHQRVGKCVGSRIKRKEHGRADRKVARGARRDNGATALHFTPTACDWSRATGIQPGGGCGGSGAADGGSSPFVIHCSKGEGCPCTPSTSLSALGNCVKFTRSNKQNRPEMTLQMAGLITCLAINFIGTCRLPFAKNEEPILRE